MRAGPSRRFLIVAALVCAGLLLTLVFYPTKTASDPRKLKDSPSMQGKANLAEELPADSASSDTPRENSSPDAVAGKQPLKTRSSDRGATPDRSKLPTVDLMASAEEMPPWPDGPRVMAEVSTETKRFINLRPNNVGIMPTINIGTEESAVIRLDFPDGSPGDRVHVELVDGGYFSGTDKSGQVLTLGEIRKLEFEINSDDRGGVLKLLLRQSGHTRVIPFWVGPLQPLAQSAHN